MTNPLLYYEDNIVGSMNLAKMMEKHGCKNFIFSSSSSVYGNRVGCLETDTPSPISPYSQTKFAVDMMLSSLGRAHKDWRLVSLRYFNPCGAHKSGLLGDEPLGYPNNLFPFIQEVILKRKEKLVVFGNDYPNPDGTCIRDYIHIFDLARAHILAMENLQKQENPHEIFNLGSGCGYSVLQVVKGFEKALNRPLNYEMGPRRAGDGAKLIANSEKALNVLGWKKTKSLE